MTLVAVRMTFQRMADRRPVETSVERDDGVVFAMRGGGGGADLPHDLVHAVVEAALPLADGSGAASPTAWCGAACGTSRGAAAARGPTARTR